MPVDIIQVNMIQIECDKVTSSFQNGTESHIMHEFYPQVLPGYKIIDTLPTIIYLPVQVKPIHNTNIRLTDQNGALIDLKGETASSDYIYAETGLVFIAAHPIVELFEPNGLRFANIYIF